MAKNRGPWLELFRSTWLGSQLSDAVSWDSDLAGLGIGCIGSGIAASTDDPSKVADWLGPAGSTSWITGLADLATSALGLQAKIVIFR